MSTGGTPQQQSQVHQSISASISALAECLWRMNSTEDPVRQQIADSITRLTNQLVNEGRELTVALPPEPVPGRTRRLAVPPIPQPQENVRGESVADILDSAWNRSRASAASAAIDPSRIATAVDNQPF